MHEKQHWKDWADSLRKEMMTSFTAEVTKSTADIFTETGTTKAESTLRSVRFWTTCQTGNKPNDFLAKAGFDIEFEADKARKVNEVTLKLNQTWMSILLRAQKQQKK